MKAATSMSIDTVWGNQIGLKIEAELDNPHILTTRELASLMVGSLRILIEEVRSENERVGIERSTLREGRGEEEQLRSGPARERERYEELAQEREMSERLRGAPSTKEEESQRS